MGLRAPEVERHRRCFEAYGLSYRQLCVLVLVVARWRHGQLLTSRCGARPFLEYEEGGSWVETDTFRALTRKRLIEPRRRAGNRCWFAPTSTGLAKIGRAGQGERAA